MGPFLRHSVYYNSGAICWQKHGIVSLVQTNDSLFDLTAYCYNVSNRPKSDNDWQLGSKAGMAHVTPEHFTFVSKVKQSGHLCSALVCVCYSSLEHSAMARANEGSHVYPHTESDILPLLPSHRTSPHFGRYSFPIPHRVGGWVGLSGWFHTKVVCLPQDGHPSQY